jgi:hypothetical protein
LASSTPYEYDNGRLEDSQFAKVKVNSVFLDTISASGDFIEIEKDVLIEIDVGKYIINDSVDQKFSPPLNNAATTQLRKYAPAPTGTLATIGDAEIYVACNKDTTDGSTEELESFSVFPQHFGLHTCGGFDLQFTYDKVGGGRGFYHQRIVSEPGSDYPRRKGKVFTPKIFMQEKSFTCTNTAEAKSLGIDVGRFNFKYKDVKPGGGIAIASADTETFTYNLPAGVYSPTQLGEIITDEMTKIDSLGPIGNDLNNDVYPVNSAFLTTVGQLYAKAAGKTSFFCKNDGTQFLKYDPIGTIKSNDNDRFIGASEVALQYDQDHKKMSFSILHMPQYVNDTGNNGVPGLKYDNNRLIDSYSGCFFTRLSPPDFWTTLGFSNVVASPVLDNIIQDVGTLMGGAITSISVGIGKGENRTAGFESLDTPVQKNASFRKPNPAGDIATSATLPIFGERVFSNDFNSEGYYLIEIDCGIAQDLIGANGNIGFNSTKIHSIVSNYFSQGNFTSDQGAGSLGYVHKGAPILLSNFNIRILQANGEVPDPIQIGVLNTIFLEVISKNPF